MIVGFAAITAMAVAAETNKVGLAAKSNGNSYVRSIRRQGRLALGYGDSAWRSRQTRAGQHACYDGPYHHEGTEVRWWMQAFC